jgi:Ca-activated chloride channel family protein
LARVLPFLLFCVVAALANAAGRQDEDEVVRVESDLVVLNVTVKDAEGRFARKLGRGDFRVYEDKREQKISLFSMEETPFAAAILLDTSGSMESRITLARAAAIRFLDGLRPEDVTSVYHFDSKVVQLQDFSPGRDLPPMAYDLRSRGYTSLNDAVLRASKDLASRPEKRRAIVVLSDGFDTSSGASPDKALNAALAANATVYTVDMMDPAAKPADKARASSALRFYAEKSGGRYVSTPGGRALDEAFEGILSNQYTIGYRPDSQARDGRWRSIDLQLSRAGLTARTRDGYRAPKR